MTYCCVCTYCGTDWLEYFKDGLELNKECSCKICGDKKVQIKPYKDSNNDPFGYGTTGSDTDDWSML